MSSVEQVLLFWFGELDADGCVDPAKKALWFDGKRADPLIKAQFSEAVMAAVSGELDSWASSPSGRLALIIVLDQFTRNLYRGQAEAFSGDARARRLVCDGLALGDDRALPIVMRGFFYLPLEHAENLADQEQCISLMTAMLEDAPPPLVEHCQGTLHWARDHRDIIARFGRFPHRNETLGRTATPQEIQWLGDGGKRYGQ